MSKKKTIRKAIVIGACLLAGGGIATLLLAANRKEAAHFCKRIDITVNAAGEKLFITKSDILSQLNSVADSGIINRGIETINIARLEAKLEGHQWIRDAELYFDTKDVLHVVVSEREPIARVFTTSGASFYMDSAGQRMPILPDVSVRVPVVTAFTDARKLNHKDSVVLTELTTLAQYIYTHPFWTAQIAQIDITPAGTFELMPVVGNHIIRIGHAEDIDQKLSNLLLFYKQVLRKTGVDKYAVIDVQYKDQVVGSNEKTTSAIDSVQLQRNIQDLMRRTKAQAEADSLATLELAAATEKDSIQKAQAVLQPQPAETPKPVAVKPKIQSAKTTQSNSNQKQRAAKVVPKAVMKKEPKKKGMGI